MISCFCRDSLDSHDSHGVCKEHRPNLYEGALKGIALTSLVKTLQRIPVKRFGSLIELL